MPKPPADAAAAAAAAAWDLVVSRPSEANGETGQSGVARCDLESRPAMQSAIAARTQAGMAGWQPPADMDGAAHNGPAHNVTGDTKKLCDMGQWTTQVSA